MANTGPTLSPALIEKSLGEDNSQWPASAQTEAGNLPSKLVTMAPLDMTRTALRDEQRPTPKASAKAARKRPSAKAVYSMERTGRGQRQKESVTRTALQGEQFRAADARLRSTVPWEAVNEVSTTPMGVNAGRAGGGAEAGLEDSAEAIVPPRG